MSQLTFSSIPGFTDLPDSTISGGSPLTDDTLLKISHNSKAAAVRCEIIFMGFYGAGDTVPAPVSAVDGYQYSRSECAYIWSIYSNRSRVAPYTVGQQTPPPQATTQSATFPYNFPGGWDINDLTGVVTIRTTYYTSGGSEVTTTDGIMKVYCMAQRSSVSSAN